MMVVFSKGILYIVCFCVFAGLVFFPPGRKEKNTLPSAGVVQVTACMFIWMMLAGAGVRWVLFALAWLPVAKGSTPTARLQESLWARQLPPIGGDDSWAKLAS